MYVKLYFVGQSDNQVRVEFIPQVTMIMPNGKHFLEGNVYSMWVCEEELPPTSNREAWESLLGISLWVCEEELPPKPKPPLNPYVILGEATLQLLANKDYSEWNTQGVAGKILQHAIWYLQSDIDPQRHFSLMPLLGIF